MGRQTAIVATLNDEKQFLDFLKDNAHIKLIETFAPIKDQLWKDSFEPEFCGHHTYYIWNKEFAWEPEYSRVGQNAYNPKMIGWFYICNKSDAPLIEFSRSNLPEGKYGRIYWAKNFAAPNGLSYDVDMFSKWYDLAVKWIRKNSGGKLKDTTTTYFLPEAWQLYTKQS